MAIEATRSMCCLWTDYFQDNSRKHVAMVTEDKSVVTTDDEKLLYKSRNVATVSYPFLNTL